MTEHFNFYYDESEHSRKINRTTISANNYYDNFVTAIVGWRTSDASIIEKKYTEFESKYECRKSGDELKSTALKFNQVKNGFSSLNRNNIEFVKDFLSLFDDKNLLYFSVTSKVEFIINQLFVNYNNVFVDKNLLKYAITKSIVTYQPQDIICGMFENTDELIQMLKNFYKERIAENEANHALKYRESKSYSEILVVLDDVSGEVSGEVSTDWNYRIVFWGFENFILEKEIDNYSLHLDREGDNTYNAAKQVGLSDVSEHDSKENFGVRMADILAGVISKLLKALHLTLKYTSVEDGINKKILSNEWFSLNEQQLTLYKRLKYVLCDLNNAWYKAFAGMYSDDLICFIALLDYVSRFDSVDELNKIDRNLHGEYLNTLACDRLDEHFNHMKSC